MARLDLAANGPDRSWTPIVILDLETTDFDDCEVMQIGALSAFVWGTSLYSRFIYPTVEIAAGAAKKTGFAKNKDGSLSVWGRRVETVSRSDAVTGLLHFLRRLRLRDARAGKVVLVAHKARFDAKHLIRLFAREGKLAELKEQVQGFTCSVSVFRDALPERAALARMGDFTLTKLAEDFKVLDGVSALHNAAQDVVVLRRLLYKIGVSEKKLVASVQPFSKFEEEALFAK